MQISAPCSFSRLARTLIQGMLLSYQLGQNAPPEMWASSEPLHPRFGQSLCGFLLPPSHSGRKQQHLHYSSVFLSYRRRYNLSCNVDAGVCTIRHQLMVVRSGECICSETWTSKRNLASPQCPAEQFLILNTSWDWLYKSQSAVLTLSDQETDVTESPSEARSHSFVTWNVQGKESDGAVPRFCWDEPPAQTVNSKLKTTCAKAATWPKLGF